MSLLPRLSLTHWPTALVSYLPQIADAIRHVPPLRRFISREIINLLANSTTPRPRALSMASDYTSWPSLNNRTFTGRHLPPVAPRPDLPTEETVTALYRREREIPSTDTSVMFMSFAQWFTDSFLRTDRHDFRKNTSNNEIDFCQIYGLDETKTRMLRALRGGRLKSQLITNEEYPAYLFEPRGPGGPLIIKDEFDGLHDSDFITKVILADAPDERKDFFFAVGLEHGNSTISSATLDVLFLREHNRIAGLLQAAYRDWDDERLFQTTRNIMIVLLLSLVVQEYIRHIMPFDFPLENVPFIADGERWNRSNWVAIEFDLLYRWHPLVPDGIDVGTEFLKPADFRNNNPLIISKGIDSILSSFSQQRAGKICLANTPAFLVDRSTPKRESVEERTVSLMRKARLASFNDYRAQFGLDRMTSFDQLTDDVSVREQLRSLYGDIDELEWYVGIFAEGYPDESMMGDLMTVMVGYDAFTQALTNPLLARNVFNENTFSKIGMRIIFETKSLEQIVRRNSRTPESVQVSFKC